MMYLLDTDTLTHLHSGNTNVINRLENLQDEEVAITIVTKLEILRGRIIALANQARLVTRNLRHFRQIPHLFLENWVD
jgi:predicted nucleic acid-binding protein